MTINSSSSYFSSISPNKSLQNTQKQAKFLQEYLSKDKTYDPLDSPFIKGKVDTDIYTTFTSYDKAKTQQNVYKLFSQLISKLGDKESYSKEELLQNFPFAFDFDKKTLEVTKTYSFDEIKELEQSNAKFSVYISFIDPAGHTQPAEYDTILQNEDIFSYLGMDVGSKLYTQKDGSISKMGLYHAFSTRFSSFVSEGQTSIRGKLLGQDRSLNDEELKDLNTFLEKNKFGNGELFIWIDSSDQIAYERLLNSNMSIEEFKTKHLEFKAYIEAKQEKWLKENSLENNFKELKTKENQALSEKENKTFTPIQAKSKNKTYEGIDTNEFLKKLLEGKVDEKDFLKMLFAKKSKNIKTNLLSLNKNLDIKV